MRATRILGVLATLLLLATLLFPAQPLSAVSKQAAKKGRPTPQSKKANTASSGKPAAKSQDTKAKEKLKADYAEELPRTKAVEPKDVIKTFRLKKGLKIELVASEPLIRDPVALDFDERGRMYVCEMPEYNQYANKQPQGTGAVKLLEDTNGDGIYDKSTVFLKDIPSPTSVLCYDGGVYVGSVPHIYYCKDTNGDGVADIRRPVFSGFARDHAGEAMLNSFRWGIDNQIHISTSMAGGDIVPAIPADAKIAQKPRPVSVRGQGMFFDPTVYKNPETATFGLSSGGGQHGMSLDDWGRKFVCSNSVPSQLLIYDGKYLLRNPYLSAPQAAVDIAPAGKYTKLFRISELEPWRVLRTRLRSKGLVPGSDEGGAPAGFFTGATGVTIYRGNALPEEYQGSLLVGEVANNLVYRAKLSPSGVTLVARRAEADGGVEFLASTDTWFRPVQMANGPDGALYIIDMYRELIEGAAFLPPAILKHMDVGSGANRGRIYRIVPEYFKQPPPPRLDEKSIPELVALLEHPNGWHRDVAARLLCQKNNPSATAPLLRKLVRSSKLPQGRAHALHTLATLNEADNDSLLVALNDQNADVRIQALQVAEKMPLAGAGAVRDKISQMVNDPELTVRYQLAFSLGSIGGATGGAARSADLAKIAIRDGGDRWVRLAVLSSSADCAGELFANLLADQKFRATAAGRDFLVTLATQIGSANRTEDVALVLKGLETLPAAEQPLSRTLVQSLVLKQSPTTKALLAGAGGTKATAVVAGLLDEAKKRAADAKLGPNPRAAAIRTLALAKFSDVKSLLAGLLDLQQPQPVQIAALETLAKFDDPAVATLILAQWSKFSPMLKTRATETLFSRAVWLMPLLDAFEKGKVARSDIDPSRLALLKSHPDVAIRARGEKLLKSTGLSSRDEIVKKYQQALTLKGDVERGRTIFRKQCSACHKLEGFGTQIGADLAAVRNRGLDAVLLNVLDPNREVKPTFLSYVAVTVEGTILTGMIVEETANSLTIRKSDGTQSTVLRVDIEELRSTGLSFMPEGLEKQIDIPAMADLLAYLGSIK